MKNNNYYFEAFNYPKFIVRVIGYFIVSWFLTFFILYALPIIYIAEFIKISNLSSLSNFLFIYNFLPTILITLVFLILEYEDGSFNKKVYVKEKVLKK